MKTMLKSALIITLATFAIGQAATTYGPVTIDTIKVVKNNKSTNWKNAEVDWVVATIDGSSTESLNIPEDIAVDSIYYNRAFEAKATSTVMFPFEIDTWRLKDATCFRYVKVTKDWDGNEWHKAPWVVYITHAYPQIMEANTPYLLIPNKDLKGISFDLEKQVTFNSSTNSRAVEYSDKYGSWNFIGTYEYKQWNEGDPDLGRVFGFAARDINDIKAGEFVKGKAGIKIRPMRAYLKCVKTNSIALAKDADDSEELPDTLEVRILDEDENGEVASIPFGTMNTKTGEIKVDESWIDLKGRKSSTKPTTKGTYYHKGQKVIIK